VELPLLAPTARASALPVAATVAEPDDVPVAAVDPPEKALAVAAPLATPTLYATDRPTAFAVEVPLALAVDRASARAVPSAVAAPLAVAEAVVSARPTAATVAVPLAVAVPRASLRPVAAAVAVPFTVEVARASDRPVAAAVAAPLDSPVAMDAAAEMSAFHSTAPTSTADRTCGDPPVLVPMTLISTSAGDEISVAFHVNEINVELMTLTSSPARTSDPASHNSTRAVGVPVPEPPVRRTSARNSWRSAPSVSPLEGVGKPQCVSTLVLLLAAT
jgi:hypothetical protein